MELDVPFLLTLAYTFLAVGCLLDEAMARASWSPRGSGTQTAGWALVFGALLAGAALGLLLSRVLT